MSFFEPVKYIVKSSASQRMGPERVYIRRPETSPTYFFNRVIRNNAKDFESVSIGRDIRRTIKENIESLVAELRAKFEKIVPEMEMIDKIIPSSEKFVETIEFRMEAPSDYYFYRHNSSVVLPFGFDSFCILSKTKEEATDLVQFITSEFEKLNEVTKDFGLELVDLITGRKYQESLLRNLRQIQSTNYKQPKNEFEKEVVEFCGKITTSFLPNIEIAFTAPNETYEYDVIIGVTDDIKRVIEPTNYETIKDEMPLGETLKSKVILATLDKAQRLGAKSIVIAKGFPENTFNELRNIAESRRVILLSDANYKNTLLKILCNDLLEAYGHPGFLAWVME